MKTKAGLRIVTVLLLLALVYGCAHATGRSHAHRISLVVIARDTVDVQQKSAKIGHDAYFTKGNPLPSNVR